MNARGKGAAAAACPEVAAGLDRLVHNVQLEHAVQRNHTTSSREHQRSTNNPNKYDK